MASGQTSLPRPSRHRAMSRLDWGRRLSRLAIRSVTQDAADTLRPALPALTQRDLVPESSSML